MNRRYGHLKLEELDATTHDVRPLRLTGMFIPQSARECAEFLPRFFELPKELHLRLHQERRTDTPLLDAETVERYRRTYYEQSPRPVLDIVDDVALSHLVILGDPGSGKSSLLQYILLRWAEGAGPDEWRDALPLMIELREYARLRHQDKVSSFLQFLHEGASVRWQLDQAQLALWMRSRQSRILFDGLDEIFDERERKEIVTAIHRFSDEYPQAQVIVTSRVIGYHYQRWRDEGFRHFMLQELDETQIGEFLARWHRDAYEEPLKGEERRELLARAVTESPSIRQFAGNPLLLTMMAILNRRQDLPRDRAELYEQCSRLLLHQWKAENAFINDSELQKAALDYKDKRGLLMRVARSMQTSPYGLAGNLIDEETLERSLAEGLRSVPGLRPERAARALIEQLRGRNFMLSSMGGGMYAFVHRTFLEHFCAAEINQRFAQEQTLSLDGLKSEVFGRHWGEETWHEVLSLLAGQIAARFVGEIVRFLLDREDPQRTCHNIFLAARCIGEVRDRSELGPVSTLIMQRLQALAGFGLPYTYEPWGSDARRVSATRTRAVALLARVFSDVPGTRDWLTARAQSDQDEDVRRAAVQELARGWKDHPDTLPLLLAHAQSDQDEDVRQVAVQELARGWKDHPDTQSFLSALAKPP